MTPGPTDALGAPPAAGAAAPRPPVVELHALCLVLVLGAVYTGVNLYRLAHFYPLEFDLAIFSQGLHKLTRFETPFVTVRGMNLFGDHATWVHLPLVPLASALGPTLGIPRLLVLVQSAALGLSGLFLHRIARQRLGAPGARVVLAAYLVYPALQYTWLEYYEPVNLALPCLFAAYAAIREGRDRPALLWCLLALGTMENLAATVIALGLWAILRGQRVLGRRLVIGSLAYVAFLLGVVFPWLHPGGYVYVHRLWGEGGTLPGALAGFLVRLASPENGRYLLALFVPAGLLPLLAPGTLLLAAQLPLNLIAAWPYAHEIRYHYVAPVIPFVWLAVVETLARLRHSGVGWRLAMGALVAGALAGQVAYASPWLVPRAGMDFWRGRAADRLERDAVLALLARIPPDAAVSADYRFLPHLVRREALFMFPDLGPGGAPDVVLVDLNRPEPGARETQVLEGIEDHYDEVARTPGGTVLLRRRGYRPEPQRSSPPARMPSVSGAG